MKSGNNKNDDTDHEFDTENLIKHFQSQGEWHGPKGKNVNATTINDQLMDKTKFNEITDKPITISEVKKSINSLKFGKSCGPDNKTKFSSDGKISYKTF